MKAHEVFENAVETKKVSIQMPKDIYVIAEIGINHNGDLNLAKEMIDVAVASGCDAVKFQKRTIDIVYSKEELDKYRESPWGKTQREQKEGLEFGTQEYDEIDDYCKSKGIEWSASAWDLNSLDFIEKYDPPFHKIASALTTNLDFVEKVATLGRATFMSTGMCTYEEIEKSISVFKKYNTKLVLMHTVSTYPSNISDLNLLQISELCEKFSLPVGYSGHEANVSPTLVAASLGAVAIERHITTSRAIYGSDQAASLEPAGLSSLVGSLKKVPIVKGTGIRVPIAGEEQIAKKLRYWLV